MSKHESSHEKALKNKKGKDIKGVNNLVKGNEGRVDEKGKRPRKEFGAKNNDSQED